MNIMIGTAVTVAFLHTLVGPDHYLPFIVMGKARNWSYFRTTLITTGAGLAHVLGSVILGLVGVAAGIGIQKITDVDTVRGSIAAWLFVGFGLAYMAWGIRHAYRKRPHTHIHLHPDGIQHEHQHTHTSGHTHFHDMPDRKNITPWILFTIFVLGPCEPLIPIVMYPAAKGNYHELIITVTVFGVITIMAMLGLVLGTLFGLNFLPLGKLERYSHALAGFAILFSGAGILFMGW